MYKDESEKVIMERELKMDKFFDTGVSEFIRKQQKMMDSIRIPIETAPLITDQMKSISLHFDNSLFETIQKQQTQILNNFALSVRPVSIISERLNQISSVFSQEISLINKAVPVQLSEVIKGMGSYQKHITSIQESVGSVISGLNHSHSMMIQNIAKFNFDAVNWSKLDFQFEEVFEGEEFDVLPTKQEIKEATSEILEESGIFQFHENIEEQLNTLIHKAEKCEQPWYKAVFISIIATFVIFLLNPILEPLQQEYTNFIQQNGRTMIKKIQIKVQEEFGSSPFLKEYKIISTQEMIVRITNKKDSSSVGKVYFGQLVRVINKQRNWTLVQYENEDGELIEGWVYTRYLSNITY